MTQLTITFDYAALDSETRIVVQRRTDEIRDRMRRAAQDIFEIGERLTDVRDRLGDESFSAWLRAEFQLSRRTAYNLIGVYVHLRGRANFAQLDIAASALYLLAAPSTPDDARAEALERAAQGEPITHRAAQEIITAHKPPAPPAPAAISADDIRESLLAARWDSADRLIAALPTRDLRRDWGRDLDRAQEAARCAETGDSDGAARAALRIADSPLREALLARHPAPAAPPHEADDPTVAPTPRCVECGAFELAGPDASVCLACLERRGAKLTTGLSAAAAAAGYTWRLSAGMYGAEQGQRFLGWRPSKEAAISLIETDLVAQAEPWRLSEADLLARRPGAPPSQALRAAVEAAGLRYVGSYLGWGADAGETLHILEGLFRPDSGVTRLHKTAAGVQALLATTTTTPAPAPADDDGNPAPPEEFAELAAAIKARGMLLSWHAGDQRWVLWEGKGPGDYSYYPPTAWEMCAGRCRHLISERAPLGHVPALSVALTPAPAEDDEVPSIPALFTQISALLADIDDARPLPVRDVARVIALLRACADALQDAQQAHRRAA